MLSRKFLSLTKLKSMNRNPSAITLQYNNCVFLLLFSPSDIGLQVFSQHVNNVDQSKKMFWCRAEVCPSCLVFFRPYPVSRMTKVNPSHRGTKCAFRCSVWNGSVILVQQIDLEHIGPSVFATLIVCFLDPFPYRCVGITATWHRAIQCFK